MNKLMTTLVLGILICSTVQVSAQHADDRIDEIINTENDVLFKETGDYHSYASNYRESVVALAKMQRQADSVRKLICRSSLTTTEQGAAVGLIDLAINDTPGDVSLRVKEIDPLLISPISKQLGVEFIYELERNYHLRLLTIKKTKSWAERISKFIHNNAIDYFNAAKLKVPDTVFLAEVKTYQFRKQDVVADIGAGSGYFERVLSMYCDQLTVYAGEISSSGVAQLITRLKFLELHDGKEITYRAVLGNENSSLLPSNHFDKVIIRNTYHHFSNPDKMMADCKRILKKEGKLYVVDVLIDQTVSAPECKLHLTRKAFLKVIQESGFNLINETKLGYDQFKCFEFQLML